MGLLGENGAGKSTLIEMMIGLRWPDTGEIVIDNIKSTSKDPAYLSNMALLSHDIYLNGQLTVEMFLRFNQFFFKNYSIEIEKELLDLFEISSSKKISDHSTGQQRKIQIIGALAANTDLIIIDEITAVLDPKTRDKLTTKLFELSRKSHKTILIATNVIDDLPTIADKILFIKDTKIIEDNTDQIKQFFSLEGGRNA